MDEYPITITNGAGERLTFLRLATDADGEFLEVENCVAPKAGPPMHVHYRQDESLTVQQGSIVWQVLGEQPQYGSAGDTVTFQAGTPHKFWNCGDDDLICTGWVRPPHNVVYFLSALFDSQKRHGGGRPDPTEAAYLVRRYRTEFGILEVPPFVQRFIFPLQVGIGHLSGKFKRYRDAPEPLR